MSREPDLGEAGLKYKCSRNHILGDLAFLFSLLPVARTLLGEGVTPKLVDETAGLNRTRVANNLVAVLCQRTKLVERRAKVEGGDPACIRGGACK